MSIIKDDARAALIFLFVVALVSLASYRLGVRAGRETQNKIWCESLSKSNINIPSCE